MQGYRDLDVWKKAMDLAAGTYGVTRRFPREELFGLTSQIRRSASSVPANIAEGWGRETRPAYINHLRIAQGSLKELETHLLLAQRVSMTTDAEIVPLLKTADDVGRMHRALIRSVERSAKPSTPTS